MWPNNNFRLNNLLTQGGSGDNSYQSNTNQDNSLADYQESEIDQGNGNFVNFPYHATGFPVYPLYPFEYYQPLDSNYIGSYMPNMFQQMPGFGNNGFLQAAFTHSAISEEDQPTASVASTHPNVSKQSVPPIRPTSSAQSVTPTQSIALVKPTRGMSLDTRAEELKAQLIKRKEERAKAKIAPKADEADAGTLDPTSEEMASLLQGSPTKSKKQSKDPMSGSMVSSPQTIVKGIVTGNTGSKPTRNGNLASGTAESKSHEIEVTKPIAAGKAPADENYKKHLGSNGLPASKIQPSPKAAEVVQNNAQRTGPQTKLSQVHSKPAASQVKVLQDTERKRTVSKESQEKVQTEKFVPEVVGKGKLPSAPAVVEKQVLIKSHTSTITRDNKPSPRNEYPERRERRERRESNANTIDKLRIDVCNKDNDKYNSNAKNSTNNIHSPKEDKHSPLEKVVLSNDDLRDWLKLTKWDDLAHRKRALKRHRAIAAIDKEKAHLLESVAKIAALDKEKAKLVAEVTEDEDGFGDKHPGGHARTYTTRATVSSDEGSIDSFDQATRPTRKRSFTSFTNSNRIPLQPNSRHQHAAEARTLSPSNTGKEVLYDHYETPGERRGFNDRRDMSPRLKAFLDREDAREARETAAHRHNARHSGNHHENRPYRDYRGRSRGRGRGDFDRHW